MGTSPHHVTPHWVVVAVEPNEQDEALRATNTAKSLLTSAARTYQKLVVGRPDRR